MRKKSKSRVVKIVLLLIATVTLALLLVRCGSDIDCKLTIVYPSIAQGTIAPARDFYVIGDMILL